VRLVDEDANVLFAHRGQVVGVTNFRLLFAKSRQPFMGGGGGALDSFYTIESLPLASVVRVHHKTTIELLGAMFGAAAVIIGLLIAYLGLTGEVVGPGVIFIPLLLIPFGIATIFSIRRRRIIFTTKLRSLRWLSGPLEIRKTRPLASQARELLMAQGIPVAGF
jgi:hypothetical protein